jgi:hypothetical protein
MVVVVVVVVGGTSEPKQIVIWLGMPPSNGALLAAVPESTGGSNVVTALG